MNTVSKLKSSPSQSKVIGILNQTLADLIVLKLCAKQAHWNIKGANFIALHELFDKVASQADDYTDLIAERVAQLGGMAKGGLKDVFSLTQLSSYPATHDSDQHVKALSRCLRLVANDTRMAIDEIVELKDAVTADLFTEVTAGLDKLTWFVEAHS